MTEAALQALGAAVAVRPASGAQDRASPNFMGLLAASLGLDIGIFGDFLLHLVHMYYIALSD